MRPNEGHDREVMRLRAATAGDQGLLARATLGNVNWNGPRFTADQVRTNPHLWHYVACWPGPGDFGYVAEDEAGAWIGVAWLKHFSSRTPGYGFIDETIPELSIHVIASQRGRGAGTRLLVAVIDEARRRLLPGISLSVEPGNPALRLYTRHGFAPAGPDHDASTCLLAFGA
ncbi:MAG: GNAT family N-acetyltransferase [Micrococcales bacterium]|nr:GNAT family N-acetyltransferase [Micrococcales bacterium]